MNVDQMSYNEMFDAGNFDDELIITTGEECYEI